MISKKGINNENKKELNQSHGAKANLSNIGMLATSGIGGSLKNRVNSEMGLLSKKQDPGIDGKFSNIYGGNNLSNNSAFAGSSVYDFIGKNEFGGGKRGSNFGGGINQMLGSDMYKYGGGGGMNGGDGFYGKNPMAPVTLSSKNALKGSKYVSPDPDVNVLTKFHGF